MTSPPLPSNPRRTCAAALNLYAEYQLAAESANDGISRSTLFYVIFFAAILYTFANRLAPASSKTDTYSLPTLAFYREQSASYAPTCPCSSSNGMFIIGDAIVLNKTATWTEYRLSSAANICNFIHIMNGDDVCYEGFPCPPWAWNLSDGFWADMHAWDMMCISMITAQETSLQNALSTSIPLTTLISEASLSSIITNSLRDSLQLQVLTWANLVYSTNLASITGDRFYFNSFLGYNMTAYNIANNEPVASLNLTRAPTIGEDNLERVISFSVTSMFLPLASPSFFRPADFSGVARDLFSVDYEAYFKSCAPIKCDITSIMDWKEQLLDALSTLGGFGSFLFSLVYWIPFSFFQMKSKEAVAPST